MIGSSQLPVVQHRVVPATRSRGLPFKALPASFVGSMAVLAVGTGLEWAARRIVPSAAKAAGRAMIGQERVPATHGKKDGKSADNISVDEVLYVRKVQIRR